MLSKVSGTISADGSTTGVLLTASSGTEHEGFFLHLSGTFGSGTITVEFQAEGGAWVGVSNGAFTAATDKKITLPNNTNVRLTTTGSTTPSVFYQMSGAGSSGFN